MEVIRDLTSHFTMTTSSMTETKVSFKKGSVFTTIKFLTFWVSKRHQENVYVKKRVKYKPAISISY